jgi:hypothetical protein
MLASIKEAAQQMKGHAGPKIVVLDRSWCRSICDAIMLAPRVGAELRRTARDRYPAVTSVLAMRESNLHFGALRFEPTLAELMAAP